MRSLAAEECVSYCHPSQVKVRMNLETYCLKDYGWCLFKSIYCLVMCEFHFPVTSTVFVSVEGAGERDGAFGSLVAVLHLRTNRLSRWVRLPCSQGPPDALGARPRPQLWLPSPPPGSHFPPDRGRGRGAGLGPGGAAPGGRSLHSGPPVAGTLEPQTQGLPGAGQEGTLPSKIPQQPQQGPHKVPVWVHPPSLTD